MPECWDLPHYPNIWLLLARLSLEQSLKKYIIRIKLILQMRKESVNSTFCENGLSSVESISLEVEKTAPPGTMK